MRHNIALDRLRLLNRCQEEGESFDKFLTSLQELADEADLRKISHDDWTAVLIMVGTLDDKALLSGAFVGTIKDKTDSISWVAPLSWLVSFTGNRTSYSAALGALTFWPKAEVHLKIGTCVVVADSDESPLHQWDLVQIWSASSNELVLMDFDRAKVFHLDDTSFNVVEEVDLWRRHQPHGGYFGPTMKIHRLPYKSSESKLIQAEASDVGFAREMEIGGMVHALENFRGCSITGCVSPKNRLSESHFRNSLHHQCN